MSVFFARILRQGHSRAEWIEGAGGSSLLHGLMPSSQSTQQCGSMPWASMPFVLSAAITHRLRRPRSCGALSAACLLTCNTGQLAEYASRSRSILIGRIDSAFTYPATGSQSRDTSHGGTRTLA